MGKLRRTKPAAPSKLAVFEHCALRYLLETERFPATVRLGAAPAALLGTAVHKVVATHGSTVAASVAAALQAIERELDGLMAVRSPGMAVAAHVVRAGGRSTLFPFRMLLAQAQLARSLATRFPASAGSGGNARAVPDVVLEGSERWLHSSAAGIAGIVDFIDRPSRRLVRIVDFKSGSLTGEGGTLKREYSLQMWAYGEAVSTIEPGTAVRLELAGRNETWAGEYDACMREEVQRLLALLERALPMGEDVPEQDLASPGGHCARCSARPCCSAYKDAVARDGVAVVASRGGTRYDVAGVVVEATERGGLATIRLTAASGRSFRIVNVPTDLLTQVNCLPGASLWGHDLASLEASETLDPRNFYVISPSSLKDCAFSAMLSGLADGSTNPN